MNHDKAHDQKCFFCKTCPTCNGSRTIKEGVFEDKTCRRCKGKGWEHTSNMNHDKASDENVSL
eukprot:UN03922